MTVRNLDKLFRPGAIALIGASKNAASVGGQLARNLLRSGFDGPVMPVNPKHRAVQGTLAYPDIASLPLTPDLAIIATPPATVPGIVAELGARGTKAAVVITAGFGEGAGEGAALRQAMLEAARPHLMRIVGPNCLGILVPEIGLNASFAHLTPQPGKLAFVAQSGAVVTSVLDWACSRGIGFSHLVSLGDMADVDFGDLLDYLANDRATGAVLLYIEAINQARKFMSAGRAAARSKPVIVVKAGRHPEGARAAASHTGALAGADQVYDTAFRRAGMLRVLELEELFDVVQTLARIAPPQGDRLAIITNGGGAGVMATDALIDQGGRLAPLAPVTIKALDDVLPPTWSKANPIDIIGDAGAARYAASLAAVLPDPTVDGILVINCPTAMVVPDEAAQAVIEAVGERRQPPVLTSWLGEGSARPARERLGSHGLPTYATPSDAVRAFMQLVRYRQNQETLRETPPSLRAALQPDHAAARALIDRVLAEERSWLTEPEAKALVAAYGIPVARALTATTPAEAAAAAAELGSAVVLKILSPDITHKSDVGGVALELMGPKPVEAAAHAMLERVRDAQPDAQITGFSIQPMIRRPGAYELIIGMTSDPKFGPLLLFGQGGTAVEVVNDQALALPPLNLRLAHEVMARTRIHRLLRGYRDRAPVQLDAIAESLIKLSQLVVDFAEIAELDINPLLADEYGVIALDARVKVAPAATSGTGRLAIRPYPQELERTLTLADGRELLVRPVLPEDEPAFHEGFRKLTAEEIRLRFFSALKALSHATAARLTQIDYDREMALVLAAPGVPGRAEIFGVVRIIADPDNERAEFAIIVRRDMAGQGLGRLLLEQIIAYARQRGIGEIFGDVLQDNQRMLHLCERLGFSRAVSDDEPGIVRVTLRL